MGDKALHVQNAALDQSDSSRPSIGITILELEVDLLGTEAHERNLHVRFANADDKDFTAKLDGVDLDVFSQ